MGKKKIANRSKIKSFVMIYDYNHLVPTRNSVAIPLDKSVVKRDIFRDPALKRKARREAKLEGKYKQARTSGSFRSCSFRRFMFQSLKKA
ncbi:60S ribosomal protein L27 [Tupaia chinensis]|uniref:60S ribosomal protein L27 n=1 Tax=Tupaia chinensis TaxID=246437 RepID=L8Y691_TUPCH|nr:60S ribosomal protein L27 [Tupaia chinensis]